MAVFRIFTPMRVLALFFAFYFLVLGSWSCTEVELGSAQPQQTVVKAAGTTDAGSWGDWCSPLCQCHCCPGFSLPAAPAVSFSTRPAQSIPALCFATPPMLPVPARAPVTPWQPPQVA